MVLYFICGRFQCAYLSSEPFVWFGVASQRSGYDKFRETEQGLTAENEPSAKSRATPALELSLFPCKTNYRGGNLVLKRKSLDLTGPLRMLIN